MTMTSNVSLWRRLAAMLYDSLLVFSLVFFLIGIITLLGVKDDMIFWLITLPAIYFYFIYSWIKGGQTLGMKSFKIILINNNYRQTNLRFIYAMLSFLLCGFGFLYQLFNKKNLALHDKWSHTYLIRKI